MPRLILLTQEADHMAHVTKFVISVTGRICRTGINTNEWVAAGGVAVTHQEVNGSVLILVVGCEGKKGHVVLDFANCHDLLGSG